MIRLWIALSILWVMGMGIYSMPDAITSFKTAFKAEQEIKVLEPKLQELRQDFLLKMWSTVLLRHQHRSPCLKTLALAGC